MIQRLLGMVTALSLVLPAVALADVTPGAGKPLIRNYDQREFGAEVQAWDVVQHPSGLVYAANNAGVLEFDGRSWRLIGLPSRLEVRSLALDPSGAGRVYVGASGDFGYLAPDAVGQLTFRSLLPPHARDDDAFDEAFRPTVTAHGVFFQSRHRLCLWANERLSCRSGAWRSRVFVTPGRAWTQTDTGLAEVTAGDVVPVTGGQPLVGSELTVVLPSSPRGSDRLLIGLRRFELYLQDGDRFVRFAPALSPAPGQDALLGATWLPDGTLAIATEQRGVLVVDAEGRLLRRIDERVGLQENHVHAIWPDREGGLWLGLQHGISRVDIGGPYTSFDEDFGLQREWRAVERIGSMLYVRGYRGLYAADLSRRPADATGGPAFRQIAAIAPPAWHFQRVDDALLVTSSDAVYEVVGWTARRLATLPSMPMALHASRSESGLVFVGLVDGIGVLRRRGARWQYEGRLEGVHQTITSLVEERRGRLWAVSQRQRVLRIDVRPDARPDASSGLIPSRATAPDRGPVTGRVIARIVAGRVVLLAENGVFGVDDSGTRLVRSALFDPLLAAGRRSFAWIAESERGDIWVASRSPGTVDRLEHRYDGDYAFDVAGSLQVPVWSVYPDPVDPTLWLAGTDRLLRYDLRAPPRPVERATTLIRRVTINDGAVVFGGADPAAGTGTPSAARLEFPHRSNAVHFEFAAPRFASPTHTEYQSYLEGFDPAWSPWSRDPSRSYTNLPFGRYRFHVRSRDAGGATGAETVFPLDVQPPWFRTTIAYVSYAVALVAAVAGAWTLQFRRARRRFEHDVQQRELDRLREIDRLKSRVFADIAHEFRTPLTLIVGPVTQLLEQVGDADVRRRLALIRSSADAMLRLLSQLLDLARLDAGRVRLKARRTDLVATVRQIVLPFTPVAEKQDVQLQFEALAHPDEPAGVIVHVDCDVIEKVVNNLLVNALKFTPAGGTVHVRVGHLAAAEAAALGWASGGAEIAVEDTGIGVPAAQLPHIFNRFFQVGSDRARDGIGIGLALVRELVDLHAGTVGVSSVEGRGSSFVVRLPGGTAHLVNQDIDDERHLHDAPSALEPVHVPVVAADHASILVNDADGAIDDTTVLVVEDHAEVRAFLCDHLRAHYRVLEARNGDDGLRLALERLPDLVLSDVAMDGLDGFELCRALKQNEKTGHIPVVLLTARAGRDDRLTGLGLGADSYIVKPFDSSELLAQVRNLIEQRRRLRERFRGPVVLKPAEMAVAPVDEVFLTRVLHAIEAHLDDGEFDVERLGRAVGLSRSQLHRKLRALTNQSPTMVIRSVRLQRAAALLQRNAGTIAEIAYTVGFSSQAYFAKCFREQFGCTPKEYSQNAVDRAS